jgi:hypothetical protein
MEGGVRRERRPSIEGQRGAFEFDRRGSLAAATVNPAS